MLFFWIKIKYSYVVCFLFYIFNLVVRVRAVL
jgi:hypothetical protein